MEDETIECHELSACELSSVISTIANRNLTCVTITDSSIYDLSFLGGNSTIAYLDLRNNDIYDLSPLKDNHSIETLILRKNAIRDLSPLQDNRTIRCLDLGNNQLEDITPLINNDTIEALGLQLNRLRHIPSLSRMTSLKTLYVNNNRIESLDFLRGTSIEEVTIHDNPIPIEGGFSPLIRMTSLIRFPFPHLLPHAIMSTLVNRLQFNRHNLKLRDASLRRISRDVINQN